jgi:hypothetical protein
MRGRFVQSLSCLEIAKVPIMTPRQKMARLASAKEASASPGWARSPGRGDRPHSFIGAQNL